MTQQHPIIPPLELLKHWENQHFDEGENYDVMLIEAYQAGAEQELEACCKWLKRYGYSFIVESLKKGVTGQVGSDPELKRSPL